MPRPAVRLVRTALRSVSLHYLFLSSIATLGRAGHRICIYLPLSIFDTWMLTWDLLIVFHLAHCATQCAAPKLWSVLK